MTRFGDAEHGGFLYTASDHEPLIVRRKDALDAPCPAAMDWQPQSSCGSTRSAAATTTAKRPGRLLACLPVMRAAPTATFQLLLASEEWASSLELGAYELGLIILAAWRRHSSVGRGPRYDRTAGWPRRAAFD